MGNTIFQSRGGIFRLQYEVELEIIVKSVMQTKVLSDYDELFPKPEFYIPLLNYC